MRAAFFILILLLQLVKPATAQHTEQAKLETSDGIPLMEQIQRYQKMVIKKEAYNNNTFLDSLLHYSIKEHWLQGKLWYHYFNLHRGYQSRPINTNVINQNYRTLLEAYRRETEFDSTSFSIISHSVVYAVTAFDYYWGLALAKEQFQKLRQESPADKLYVLRKMQVINFISQIYIRINLAYNLDFYIAEVRKLDISAYPELKGQKYALLSDLYYQSGKYSLMNIYRDSAQNFLEQWPWGKDAQWLFNKKIHAFLVSNQLDSAKYYLSKSLILDTVSIKKMAKIDYSPYLNSLQLYYDSLESRSRTLEHNLDNLGHYFVRTGNYAKAKQILKPLYEIKLHYKDYDFLQHILPIVIAAYRGSDDPDSALYFTLINSRLKDSIYNFQHKKLYSTFIGELQYEINAKERLLQYKDQAIRYRNRLLWGGVAIGFISILLLLSLYRNVRLKNKFQRQKIAQIKAEQEHRALSAKINGAETEKKNLAIELHDGIANDIWALNLNIDKLKRSFNHENVTHTYIKELKTEINQVFENVLNLARNLKPSLLVKNGLAKVVMALCERINHQYDRQIAKLEVLNAIPRFDIEQELIVYRIIQELTFNALKHAKATEIHIQLAYTENSLDLTLEDNGLGIHNSEKFGQDTGQGLQNIKERVQLLNGYIEFSSLNASGTSVYINFEKLSITTHETTR